MENTNKIESCPFDPGKLCVCINKNRKVGFGFHDDVDIWLFHFSITTYYLLFPKGSSSSEKWFSFRGQ